MTIIKGFDSRSWDGYLPDGTGFKFVGIKVSQGIYFEPTDMWQLQRQWAWSKERYGLLRLPFHFMLSPLWANPKDYGIRQAEFMFTSMSEKFGSDFGELPPVIDVEHRRLGVKKDSRIANCLKACLKRTEELWGIQPMIYTAGWFWDQHVFPFIGDWEPWKIYDLWESDPPPATPIKGWGNKRVEVTQVVLDKPYNGFNANIDINETTQEWLDKVMFEDDEVSPGEETFTQEEVDALLATQAGKMNIACNLKLVLRHKTGWNEAVQEAVKVVKAIEK